MSSQQINDLESQVLVIAQQLLAGTDATHLTMDRLAAESGVSRATLYRHFGSRSAILKRLSAELGVQVSGLEDEGDIRKRILQAARAVISRIGSFNFTIEQVAEQAGVGVATVYRHFGTKENLLHNMAEVMHPRRVAQDLLHQTTGNLKTDLTNFTRNVLEFMYTNHELARLVILGDAKVRFLFNTADAAQERTLNSLAAYLETQMQAGHLKPQDPLDLSAALIGMILSFAFIKPTYTHTQDDIDRAADFIVQLFLDGVSKENQ
ncbi:MAG TPA: TetR/AcrR family transcriptional regulator [Longilinea sp.]|nr:TetR/AcrR family transcriptional regulator [Longilinea sp.]